MTSYRCKHAVEAMRWRGDGVMPLEKWHEEHTGMRVRWHGLGDSWPSVLTGEVWRDVEVGQWIVLVNGEFLVLDDEQFRETYEEVR